MTSSPWHTEQWFVSPWNYLSEVTDSFRFPEKIEIHDLLYGFEISRKVLLMLERLKSTQHVTRSTLVLRVT